MVPEIGTFAKDKTSGTKEMTRSGVQTLVDMVTLTGLTPGEEYKLNGEVMDKATGESIGLTAELKFTPETADGSVDIEFALNTDKYYGKYLVVFEAVYDLKGNLIGEHKDINDDNQTVHVPEIPGNVTGNPPKNPPKNTTVVTTGDLTNVSTLIAIMIASGISLIVLFAIILLMIKKKKRALGTLLLILLILGSLFGFGINSFAAETETTTETIEEVVEGVKRNEDGDFYYEFPEEIEKDGVRYKYTGDASYTEEAFEPLQYGVSEEFLTSEGYEPEKTKTINGVTYVLDHVEKKERVETARSVPVEDEYERDDMVEEQQTTRPVVAVDPVTKEEVEGEIPFDHTDILGGQWVNDLQMTLTFDHHNADYFIIEGVHYPKNTEVPLPPESYPSVLSGILALSPSRYRITSIIWNGEAYESDSILYRQALALGDTYHRTVKDYFKGDVELPDLSYTEYTQTYVEAEESQKLRQTATATAVYTAVLEETEPEPETETAAPEQPPVKKSIFQQPVFYISVISAVVIAGVVIFLAGLAKKKKKKQEEQ